MPIQSTSSDLLGQRHALLAPVNTEAAFNRARWILRQETFLTIAEFEELDALFRKVTQAQFSSLVDDPFHQRQLRSYEVQAWRRGLPVLLILLVLLLAGIATGIVAIAT